MYEMATRRVPFRGTTSALVYTQLIENDPESVRKWNESIPKDLERLILKLLAKERRDRFQSAKELSSALQKIANSILKNHPRLVGLAIAFDSLWLVLAAVPFALVINYGVIAREEAYLDRKFGDVYRRYRMRVRRWL